MLIIGLEVWRFTSVHVVCDDDKSGSFEAWTFAYCV